MPARLGDPLVSRASPLLVPSRDIQPRRRPRKLVLKDRTRVPLLDSAQIRMRTLHVRALVGYSTGIQINGMPTEFFRVLLVRVCKDDRGSRERCCRLAKNLGRRVRRVDVCDAV